MNQQSLAQEILSIRNLLQNNTIGILLGDRMNIDTAGAALGMYLALKEAGKNPQIVSIKEPVVEIANLVGINKIKKSFSGDAGRVVVSLPYNRGEIGKVSYKEENDRINFYLTAADGKSISTYENTDINLIWDGSMPSVVIAIGVSGIGKIREAMGSVDNGIKIVNIDNTGESFGDVSISDSAFSSVSEVTARIIRELRLPMNIDIAQNLMDGILYGTRNFTKTNTSPIAFEMTGVLMQAGAVRADNRNTGRGTFPQPNRQNNQNTQNNSNRNQNQRPNNNQPNQNRDRREALVSPAAAPTDEPTAGLQPENAVVSSSDNQDIPSDWLMPKVFKGSQNIDDLK